MALHAMSSSLYTYYIQSSINYIKAKVVEGFNKPYGNLIKLTAYVDGLLIFCKTGKQQKIFEFFDKVEAATGSSLNKTKTKIMGLTGSSVSLDYLVNSLQTGGLTFYNKSYKRSREKNFEVVISKIKTRLEKLNRIAELFFMGKVLFLNTSVASLIFHTAEV